MLTKEDLELVKKKCSTCYIEQSINNFHRCKNGRYGRHASCKTCTKELKKNI